jgi:polygalacturonase
MSDYPQIPTRFEGIERNWTAALINIESSENTTITGEGTIDGSGTEWPIVRPQTHLANWIGRPRLICFQNCTNLEISDLHLLNHASWCLHILYSKDVIIRGLNIRAEHNIPSSDGIDLDSSSEIYLSNCDIDVNDDCISLKAGKDSSGLAVNRPSENIIIENCRFGYGHGGVACGSETSGGIRNVLVKNCIADSGNWAPIRFKTQPSRGGFVEDVTFENITIVDAKQAFELQMEWRMVPPVLPPAKVLPVFRNITLKNVTGKVDRLGIIHGMKDSPVTGVSFVNCSLNANTGLVVENAKDNDYSGLNAEIKEGEKIIYKAAELRQ